MFGYFQQPLMEGNLSFDQHRHKKHLILTLCRHTASLQTLIPSSFVTLDHKELERSCMAVCVNAALMNELAPSESSVMYQCFLRLFNSMQALTKLF